MSPLSRPEEASPDNFFDASDKPMDMENYRPNESTMPAANMFATIRGEDEWLIPSRWSQQSDRKCTKQG